MLLVQDVACIQHARSNHLRPPRNIETVRRAPPCPPNHTTCLSPSLQVVEDRAQPARGPTSTFLPLWLVPFPVRQLVERPLHRFARFHVDLSLVPSPAAPLKKSVSCQHTVSHWRVMSTWSFGTGQENHVVCLKSEQDLFQSASLPRTRRKRIVGADL